MTALRLPPLRSRLLGTLYGLAVGDALGAPYEFQSRGSYTPTTEMEESHTFLHDGKPMAKGTWTDDTSMALCVGMSLVNHSSLKRDDVIVNMVRWYTEGYLSAVGRCFDIGNATRIALDNYHTQLTSLSPSLDLSAPLPPGTSLTPVLNTAAASSGNGSLMRLAPVPAFFHRSFDEAMDATDVQGRTTHASAWCVEACRAACVVLLGLLEETGGAGETCEERKKRVLGAGFVPAGADPADERLVYTMREVQSIVEGSYKTKKVDGIKTTGFVIHSLEAALWALWNSTSFEEGMLLLLPLGEDVDTVCAIYGQFAGALYGLEAIPRRWVDDLQRPDILSSVFGVLVEKALARCEMS